MEVTFETILEQVRQLPLNEQQLLREMLPLKNGAATAERAELKGRVRRAAVPMKERTQEYQWLAQHRAEYPGEYLALDGDRLIAHSLNAKEVFAAVDAAGIEDPLYIHVEPAATLPFAGW
jgi:hypothetical protein